MSDKNHDVNVKPKDVIERILSMELVRVTERAAVSAARLRGQQGLVDEGRQAGLLTLIELLLVMLGFTQSDAALGAGGAPIQANMSNTEALGLVLYTKYVYLFQASGLVLLTAMIGAIVLTLRHKPDVKRQVIADQNARTRADR